VNLKGRENFGDTVVDGRKIRVDINLLAPEFYI
jgi:hypothetical protein